LQARVVGVGGRAVNVLVDVADGVAVGIDDGDSEIGDCPE